MLANLLKRAEESIFRINAIYMHSNMTETREKWMNLFTIYNIQ